jgi:hypothetical protein
MFTGFNRQTCRTVIGCSGTRKELNFESTLTRSHPVDKTAGTRITSEGHGLATRQLVRSTLVGKEIPERTGYLDELPPEP